MKIERADSIVVADSHYVRITTDDGTTGIGQSGAWAHSDAVHAVLKQFEKYLVGQDPLRILDPYRGCHGTSITLTCAATTRQPSGVRAQVCIWRPTLPGVVSRWNSVDAVAKSWPYVVITVRDVVRINPTGDRAARNAPISSWPYRFSPMP